MIDWICKNSTRIESNLQKAMTPNTWVQMVNASLLSQMAFSHPAGQTVKVKYRACGSNKDVCSPKLLIIAVSAYPVDSVCLSNLLSIERTTMLSACILMEGLTCLALPSHPPPHLPKLPPASQLTPSSPRTPPNYLSLISVIHDITVAV